jgi:hypothetical protein
MVELRLFNYSLSDAPGAAALGASIGTGTLPALEKLDVSIEVPQVLEELSRGLRGGSSPRLKDLECKCHGEGVVALAETLEARTALGCRLLSRLSIDLHHEDDNHFDTRPEALRRLLASPALAELESLQLHGLLEYDEVRCAHRPFIV